MRLFEIYKTLLPNGDFYIGQHYLKEGIYQNLKYFGSGIRIKRYIQLYGKEDIAKEQLAVVPNQKLANFTEKMFIEQYRNNPNCLNIAEGGAGISGFEISQEQRKKFSLAHKGRTGFIDPSTDVAIFVKKDEIPPEGFVKGTNRKGGRWANNGIKSTIVTNNALPIGFAWGRIKLTQEQRQKMIGRKRKPQTAEIKEKHRQASIKMWQNPEYRQRTIHSMKSTVHKPMAVPIHNKNKIQCNNGIQQIYVNANDTIPDGYVAGGLPRPNRNFNATDEFRRKVSLNNNKIVFYKFVSKDSNEIHYLAGTPAIGRFLGISAGEAASVLCRGLVPQRGKVFKAFSPWEYHRIAKEEYMLNTLSNY